MSRTDFGQREAPSSASQEAREARQRRLAQEAELIARARASAAAGRVVSEEEFDAWVDSLGTDHELPPPTSARASCLARGIG